MTHAGSRSKVLLLATVLACFIAGGAVAPDAPTPGEYVPNIEAGELCIEFEDGSVACGYGFAEDPGNPTKWSFTTTTRTFCRPEAICN